MDPISFAASIVGLISVLDFAIKKGTKYYSSVRDAPKEMSSLIGETMALMGVLTTLKHLVDQQKSLMNPGKDSFEKSSVLHEMDHRNTDSPPPYTKTASGKTVGSVEPPLLIRSCQEALLELIDIVEQLEKQPDEKLKNAAKRLRWPFMESRIKHLFVKIERHKSSFQLAISTDNLQQIQQLLEGTSEILANMDDMKTALESEIRGLAREQRQDRENFLRRERERTNREVLNFLSTADYTVNHSIAQRLQQKGTCKWFLDGEEFQTWLSAEKSFLWVHGIAGAGKTILTSMAIDEVQSYCMNRNHRLAYFYCDFKDSSNQNPINLLGSIIGQLATQETHFPNCLQELYDKFDKGRSKPSMRKLLDTLVDVLKGYSEHHNTYIILDALDECIDREELIAGLVELQSLPDLRVNILVTSRSENDLKESFDGLPFLCIQEDDIAGDVELYVTSEMEKRRELKVKPDAVKSRIRSTLVAGAKGMFRWVRCQLDVLCKARTIKATYQALNNLPIGLDDTYERILHGIDDDDFELASRALKWITCSRRSLKIEELAEALAVSPNQRGMDEEEKLTDPSEIFSICGNLLHSTLETIGLAHYSVQEFLTSPRLSTKPDRISRFAISRTSVHGKLGTICLTYLAFDDFGGGPCRNPKALRERLTGYPLLDYAATYWGRHAELGDIALEGNWLSELFTRPGNPKLLSLLEVMSYRDRKNPVRGFEGRYYDDERESILCILIRFGFSKLAKRFLEAGADVNDQGGRYGNVLQLVSSGWGDAQMVEWLLQRGAKVNATGGSFGNALQAASYHANLDTIRVLLKWGANVNAEGGDLKTALQAAALSGSEEAVKLCLEHGADVNITGGYYGSPLRAAAITGQLGIAKILLEHGADINARDKSCNTALGGAAESGNCELVKLLLEHGADVNPSLLNDAIDANRRHFSFPLTTAASAGHEKVVQLLLENGADVNAVDAYTALSAAAVHGNDALMDLLLAKGADINGRWGFQGNPLQSAIINGHLETARRLLQLGANPDGSQWFTGLVSPLITASALGNEEVIRLLIQAGADINTTGLFVGGTLQEAVLWSNAETVKLLIELGADINLQGGVYGSAFLAAVSSGKREIVELLVSLGALTTTPDCFGFNVGHYVKYRWSSIDDPNFIESWSNETEMDRTKCKETIRLTVQALKDCLVDLYMYDFLGRGLLHYGLEDEALTSFERGIRRIGYEGAFVHTGRKCDACDTPDMISGPRYVCKTCWKDDYCKQCHIHVQKSHGVEFMDSHDFYEIPRPCWYDLPYGVVNERGEKLDQWLDRLETMFKD